MGALARPTIQSSGASAYSATSPNTVPGTNRQVFGSPGGAPLNLDSLLGDLGQELGLVSAPMMKEGAVKVPTGGQWTTFEGRPAWRGSRNSVVAGGATGGAGTSGGSGGAGGTGAGGTGAGGAGAGAGGAGPAFQSILSQTQTVNPYQQQAYQNLADVYANVPDYLQRALGVTRSGISEGLAAEQAAAGRRGFGADTGIAQRGVERVMQAGGRTLADATLAAQQQAANMRAQIAQAMGGLGTSIAQDLLGGLNARIGAFNAASSYALGQEGNQIAWQNALTNARNPLYNIIGSVISSAFL